MNNEKPPKDHFGSIPISEKNDTGEDVPLSLASGEEKPDLTQEESSLDFIEQDKSSLEFVEQEESTIDFVELVEPGESANAGKGRSRRPAMWIMSSVIFLLLIYVLAGFFLVPYVMSTILPQRATKQQERPFAVGTAAFNPLTLTATLHNGIIGPRQDELSDNADPILSFGLLKINFSFLSLLSGDFVAQEVHCNDLFLHLVRRQNSTLNITGLIHSSDENPTKAGPSFIPTSSSFSLRNITVENSAILFVDKKNESTHRVEELQMALPYISNQRKEQGLYKDFLVRLNQGVAGKDELLRPQFSAKINGSQMTLSGETQITKEKVEASLQIQLKALDLADLWSALPQTNSIILSKGSADLDLNLIFTTSHDSSPDLQISGNASLSDLWFQDKQGKEVARIPKAQLTGRGSPLSRVFHFPNCVLETPSFHLDKSPQGDWPLASLFSPDGNFSEGKQPGFLWSVERLKISNGRAGIIDKTVQGGFSMSLTDVQGTLSSLGNNSQENGTFAFTARLGENGGLSVQGDINQASKETTGTLVFKNINLVQFDPYLSSNLNMHIKSGQLPSFESNFQWFAYEQEQKPLALSQAKVTVENLSLFHKNQQILNAKDLSISKGEIDFSKHFIELGSITTQITDLTMVWDKNGDPFWQTEADKSDSQWQVNIQNLEADQSRFHLVHQGLAQPFSFLFSNINLSSHGLSGNGETDNFQLTADLPHDGKVTLNGSLAITPFAGSLALKIDSLSLPELQPLFASWLVPTVTSGLLAADGNLSIPDWSFSGTTTLENFAAYAEQKKIVAWQKTTAENVQLGFSPFSFKTTNLPIEKPFLAWTIQSNDSPINQFFHNQNDPKNNQQSSPILSIDHLGLNNGSLEYRDKTTTPPFSLVANEVHGSATGLIKMPGNRAHFSLSGEIKQASAFGIDAPSTQEMTAPISISGTAGLFDSDIFFDLKTHFKDLSLVPLSPYLEPHLGYLIRRGILEATISYFVDTNKVKSENNLLVRKLKLGEPVADVTNLPLTIAILTDQKGIITLDIPVRGDRNDSSFTVRGALVKSIRNLFIRTMTSPFTLLSSLFPDQPAPDTIHFAFGHSELTEEAKTQLANLAEVLRQRPWLQISLKGFADSKGDIDALLALQETEKLRRRLERERKLAAQLPTTYGKEEIIPLRDIAPKGEESADEEKSPLPEIGEKTLHRLAKERCKTVQRFLADSGIAPERLIENSKTSLVKEDNLGPSGNRVQFSLESLMPE